MPRRGEWQSQEAYWVFLQKALPHGALCRSVDESALRSREANMRRKARGCLGGFGDIYIFWRGVTVWLEAKEAKGSLRSSQESFRDLIRQNHGYYAEVKTMEDVEHHCIVAGIPLRATLGAIRARIEEQNARLPAKRKKAPRRPQTGDRITVAQAHKMGMWRG
jgi:hypothetical protein